MEIHTKQKMLYLYLEKKRLPPFGLVELCVDQLLKTRPRLNTQLLLAKCSDRARTAVLDRVDQWRLVRTSPLELECWPREDWQLEQWLSQYATELPDDSSDTVVQLSEQIQGDEAGTIGMTEALSAPRPLQLALTSWIRIFGDNRPEQLRLVFIKT